MNNNACVDGDRNSSSLDDIASPDLESFRLVIRSCLVNDEDNNVSKEYSESLRRAKEMGSGGRKCKTTLIVMVLQPNITTIQQSTMT